MKFRNEYFINGSKLYNPFIYLPISKSIHKTWKRQQEKIHYKLDSKETTKNENNNEIKNLQNISHLLLTNVFNSTSKTKIDKTKTP